MKSMYLKKYNSSSKDALTNAEYITHLAEPKYTLIVLLNHLLSQDLLRYILNYADVDNYYEELSARTNRRLYSSIVNGNFADFKFIYDTEYIVSDVIINWFEFGEEWYDAIWNFYPLCSCWCTEHDCKSCHPVKVYRDLYIQKCRCENGKRFLAFKMIYDEAYEILSLYGKKKKQSTQTQQIVDYIIESGPIILNHSLILS